MEKVLLTESQNESIQRMISMMESCYAYGGIEKTSYNFKRYLEKYRSEMPEDVFETVYAQQAKRLSEFDVVQNVYTDCDGLTYNELRKKQP